MDKFKNKRKRSPNTDASNSEHVGVPIKKKKKGNNVPYHLPLTLSLVPFYSPESKALVKGVPSESVEEDFPRSSTSLLTPLEIKQLHQKAKQDVTEEKTSKGTKVKRMQMAPLKAVSKAKKMKHSHDIKFPSPKVCFAAFFQSIFFIVSHFPVALARRIVIIGDCKGSERL